MKAYKRLLLAAAVVMGAATAAQAADYNAPPADNPYSAFYIRGDAGWSFLTWNGGSNDNNFTLGGGVGYQFSPNMRGDLRLDYGGEYKIAPGSNLSVTTALANMYFDIPTSTAITPYLGAGAGYGWGHVSGGSDKDGFAYALMAGASVDVTQNMAVDVGYRFRTVLSAGDNPMEHQITAGVRYKF